MAKRLCFNIISTAILIFSLLNFSEAKPWYSSHTYGDSCHLKETSTGAGAGAVENIISKCMINEQTPSKEFYREISWKAPINPSTPVSSYRIYILQVTRKAICFQLPASKITFNFTRSLGLASDVDFLFTITSQPIARIKGLFSQVMSRSNGCLP